MFLKRKKDIFSSVENLYPYIIRLFISERFLSLSKKTPQGQKFVHTLASHHYAFVEHFTQALLYSNNNLLSFGMWRWGFVLV